MSFSEALDEMHAGGRKTEAVGPDHVEAGMQTKVEETGLLYDVHVFFINPETTERSDDPLVQHIPNCALTTDMGEIS